MMITGKFGLSCAAVVLLLGWAATALAGGIGSAENGDFSAGDTSNWTIGVDQATQTQPTWIYEYLDGDPHGGVLRRDTTLDGFHDTAAVNDTAAAIGQDGSIDIKVDLLNGNGGYVGIGFLGDPVYQGGTIGTINNNVDNRGYSVVFNNSWGTVNVSLRRKDGAWEDQELAATTMNYTDLGNGQWHTVTIHDDGTGVMSVDLDDTEILSFDEGASYLPTVYSANYADGGLWGAYTVSVGSKADVMIDNLAVGAVGPRCMVGDVNGDGEVGIADLSALADNYGATNATWRMGDFNDDAEVGIADLSALADNYGNIGVPCTPPTTVPEPTALALLAVSGLAALRRRR